MNTEHGQIITNLKIALSGAASQRAIFDGRLLRQVLHRVDGRVHTSRSEKRSQIGCVGGDDD